MKTGDQRSPVVRSSSSIVKSVQSSPDKVQGVQRRQCNTGVQWIRGLLRTSPLLQFPSQRRPLSKILSPAFTVQADETFKPRLQWSEMFRSYIERNQGGLDLTKTTTKLIGLNLRPSVTPVIISYMTGRSMSVKFNQEESGVYQLCGGFPQGSKIRQDCYL